MCYFGRFYYANEVKKSRSIEKQQQIDLQTKTEMIQVNLKQEESAQLDKQNNENEKKEQAEQSLNECLYLADNKKVVLLLDYCKRHGLLTDKCVTVLENSMPDKIYGKDQETIISLVRDQFDCLCSVPSDTVATVKQYLTEDKSECYKRYPIK